MNKKQEEALERRKAIFNLLKGTQATSKDIFAAIKTEFKNIKLHNIRDDLRVMSDSKQLEVFPAISGHLLRYGTNPEKTEYKNIRTRFRKTAGTRNTPLGIAMRKKRNMPVGALNSTPHQVAMKAVRGVLTTRPKVEVPIAVPADNLDKIAAIWAVLMEKPVNRQMAHTMLTIANTLA